MEDCTIHKTRAELSLACYSPTSALPLAYLWLSRRFCFGDISRFHAVAVPTGGATDCCGPNPQCGPQSHIVGTRHNALPQDKLALWSYPRKVAQRRAPRASPPGARGRAALQGCAACGCGARGALPAAVGHRRPPRRRRHRRRRRRRRRCPHWPPLGGRRPLPRPDPVAPPPPRLPPCFGVAAAPLPPSTTCGRAHGDHRLGPPRPRAVGWPPRR